MVPRVIWTVPIVERVNKKKRETKSRTIRAGPPLRKVKKKKLGVIAITSKCRPSGKNRKEEGFDDVRSS